MKWFFLLFLLNVKPTQKRLKKAIPFTSFSKISFQNKMNLTVNIQWNDLWNNNKNLHPRSGLHAITVLFFLCSDWPHCPETVRVYTIRVQKPQSIIFAGKRSKRQLHRWLTWFASLVIPQHLQRISMAHLLLLLQCKKAVWNSVYAEAR